MADFIKTQNSFADGEVAPDFFAKDNLNGLTLLENMDVMAGGGIKRRRGLETVVELNSGARIIPFSPSESENYILVITDGHLMIYNGATRVRDILTPWDFDDVPAIQYAQRFDTMIFVHPDYQPYVLSKENNRFALSLFQFKRNDDMTVNIPFMKFDDADGITISVTKNDAGNNYATFKTNKPFWSQDNVGERLLLLNNQWEITEYVNSTTVYAYTNGQFDLPSSAVSDWYEAAFGNYRGWPCSITFHQDRLIFGGSRSWPSGIWMSQVGRHNNFNVGTGLDDEAIFLTLISQERQQICTVVSSDNLQILTNAGEWVISNQPLTPSAVNVRQHTSVGSVTGVYLPPQQIEGKTVFIDKTKQGIRELSLDALGETYNANDLCTQAKHLMQNPISLSYNTTTKQLFIVMGNGDMAVLNQNSALGISAWARYTTDGQFQSVAALNGETYVIVQRGTDFYLEKFSDNALSDAQTYNFSVAASALPIRASGHNAQKLRIRKISVRVLNTKTLFINGAKALFPNQIFTDGSNGYSGDICVNLLGTEKNCINSPWTVSSDEQLPVNILSITVYGYYSV